MRMAHMTGTHCMTVPIRIRAYCNQLSSITREPIVCCQRVNLRTAEDKPELIENLKICLRYSLIYSCSKVLEDRV
jgi:hypothetical protein